MKHGRVLPLLIGALTLAAAAYGVWANLGKPASPASTGSGKRAGAGQGLPVEIVEARLGTFRSFIKLNGEVVASTAVNAQPDVGGTVIELMVQVGDTVAAGAPLARVDPSRPGARFEPSTVRAPIAGTVVRVYVQVGETLSTGSPVVEIARLDDLDVVVQIPERFTPFVQANLGADVEVTAFPGRTIRAQVRRLDPVLDPRSRSKEVTYRLLSPPKGVEPGMSAEVRLVSRVVPNALLVPIEALVRRDADDYVFVVLDGKALLRKIDIGSTTDEEAWIRNGISSGEHIVRRGQQLLKDGTSVRVIGGTPVPP